jgi:diguanylate cyclase (GGDEF)-like protein
MFQSLEMAELGPTFFVAEPDARVLEKLEVAERVALGAVIALAILNLAGSFLPEAQQLADTDWRLMSDGAVGFSLMGAFGLILLEARRPKRMARAGWVLAAAVLLLCGIIVAGRAAHPTFPVAASLSSLPQPFWLIPGRISTLMVCGFALLGLSMMLLRARSRWAVFFADLAICCLVALVFALGSGQVIDMSHVLGPTTEAGLSFQSTVCLLLLTAVAFCRRARNGVFSIFLGRGTGSRVARVLSPIVVLMPYLREWGRAHFIGDKSMPPPYTTATLATATMLVASALMLYLAWRINSMEAQIQSLSLRDELTGLYNLRGFRLLAEQALRLANRSGHPFSVLFVDLDDLKQINDQFGHFSGSQCLADTAEMLRTVFREADVLGRIGGDEFAVAGEFTEPGMVLALARLEEVVAQGNGAPDREIPLSFSFGTVTTNAGEQETLDTLLKQADLAMYEHKRGKKGLAAEIAQL